MLSSHARKSSSAPADAKNGRFSGETITAGGAGLADHWLGEAQNARPWRDIMIRVEGPAALEQQSGFGNDRT